MHPLPKLGVGLAWQPPLRPLLEPAADAGPHAPGEGLRTEVDFVEIVPDSLWIDAGPGASTRYRENADSRALLARMQRHRPVVAHSVGLSIGSADGFDQGHVAQMRRWWQRTGFPWHSDHLAFHLTGVEHRDGTRRADAGITLPLARDRESIDLLVPRIAQVMDAIPAPFLLENTVCYFDIPEAQYDEAQFLDAICRESGCGLLLDLHTLYTNARNHGGDALATLAALDLAHVGEIHVAGGMELDGVYLDTHSDVVPEPVWALLAWALPRCPNIGGVTFEMSGPWAGHVGLDAVRGQLRRLRALWDACQPAPTTTVSAA